jgi:hypothetical protein
VDILPFKPDPVDVGPCPACTQQGTRKRFDASLRLLVIECAHCHYAWFAMQPAYLQGKH